MIRQKNIWLSFSRKQNLYLTLSINQKEINILGEVLSSLIFPLKKIQKLDLNLNRHIHVKGYKFTFKFEQKFKDNNFFYQNNFVSSVQLKLF